MSKIKTKKKQLQKNNKKTNIIWLVGAGLIAVLLIIILMLQANKEQKASNPDEQTESGTESVSMEHIHGAGYTDQGELAVASHQGLKFFKDGKWRSGKGEPNDYMGFSSVDDGFFSSGHPGEGVNRPNPLGVIKNNYEGTELKPLTLEGKVDFHTFAAGFKTHTLYAVTHEKNEKMSGAGLFYSVDEGKTWKQGEAKGVDGEILAVTAHPTLEKVAAVATKNAVYISEDFGSSFKQVFEAPQITAVYWGVDGTLYAGGYGEQATLSKVPYGDSKAELIETPELKDDAVMYIAQNYTGKELALVTYNGHIFVQEKDGKWKQVAKNGKGL